MILGIALGFGAATSNSAAYLFSRAFLNKHEKSYFHLLAVSHIIMGAISAAIAPFFISDGMPGLSEYAASLAGASMFYFGAQASLFLALRKTEASRVSPLLGSKIIILSLISVIFLDRHFLPIQWLAIFFSFIAALLLSGAGVKMPLISISLVMLTCLGYCLSDLNIVNLIAHFDGMPLIKACMFSTVLCYIVCGIVSLPLLLILPETPAQMWKDAIPFTILWYMAMFFLFGCFGTIGVIYGNIIQSTRGIISVIIAAVISVSGFQSLEKKVTAFVLIKRVCAAALMTAAIALFQVNMQH